MLGSCSSGLRSQNVFVVPDSRMSEAAFAEQLQFREDMIRVVCHFAHVETAFFVVRAKLKAEHGMC